ncbi:MAG TPA: hypothetical protein VMJ31_04635, partial [Methylocystis sp.]|nr:hypothetical protein [Methylocystis sp.]
MARTQSPGYPSFSLAKAIPRIRLVFQADRRNPIDREVAAKHIGYSGTSGAADKALATLAHFNLLEKAGKGQTRVTQLAVDILHPDTPANRKKALLEAACAPSIFQDIRERFADGAPSESALKSWLMRENFLDRAIGPVAEAYLETYRYLEQERALESGGPSSADPEESSSQHAVSEGDEQMTPQSEVRAASNSPQVPPLSLDLKQADQPQVSMVPGEREWLRGPLSKETSYR